MTTGPGAVATKRMEGVPIPMKILAEAVLETAPMVRSVTTANDCNKRCVLCVVLFMNISFIVVRTGFVL